MLWVTHSHVGASQVACAWLIQRFVDNEAEFMFVAASKVHEAAEENEGMPFDVPEAQIGGDDQQSAFESIIVRYELDDPGVQEMAGVVGGIDREGNPLRLSLDALAEGYGMRFPDDEENMANQFEVYDSLYAWCRLKAARG
jgi:hypothetical protein